MIRPYRRPPAWTADQDNFVRASIGQLSDAQIAEHLQRIFHVNRTVSAVESRRWKLMSLGDESVRRGARMSGERCGSYLPTPREIEAGTAKIRATWTDSEREHRLVCGHRHEPLPQSYNTHRRRGEGLPVYMPTETQQTD